MTGNGNGESMEPTKWEEACAQALEIVGRVTAGVTHEIKNKLAVLQEQGALVQDLAKVAAAGGSLDPNRVESLAGGLVRKVRETDTIIRRMNGFAHSADQPSGCLEAREALNLMIDMHRRAADMRPVKFVAETGEKSINIETRPMLLLAALFACLEAAAEGAPRGAEIRAAVVETGPEVRFDFRWEGSEEAALPPHPELLAALEARVERAAPDRGLSLTLPARFRCGLPGVV